MFAVQRYCSWGCRYSRRVQTAVEDCAIQRAEGQQGCRLQEILQEVLMCWIGKDFNTEKKDLTFTCLINLSSCHLAGNRVLSMSYHCIRGCIVWAIMKPSVWS